MSDQAFDNKEGRGKRPDNATGEELRKILSQLLPSSDFNPPSQPDGANPLAHETITPANEPVEIPFIRKTFLRTEDRLKNALRESLSAFLENREPVFTSPELSGELKEFIETRYQQWRAELAENLEQLKAIGAYPAEGFGERRTSILEPVDFASEHAHTKAILQMDYAKTWSRWIEQLHSQSPTFLVRHSFSRHIPEASDAFDTACQEIDQINQHKLAQYFRFGYHITGLRREPSAISLATLFVEAAESTEDVSVYKKKFFLDAIEANTAVAVMKSDRTVDHPGRDGDVFFTAMDDVYLFYGAIADRRVELILAGDMFIKPISGAQSYGVQKLSYDTESETVTLTTKTALPIQIRHEASPALKAYLNGDTSQMTSCHAVDESETEWRLFLKDGTELTTPTSPESPDFVPEPHYLKVILRGIENPTIADVLIDGRNESIVEIEALPAEEGETPRWSLTLWDGSAIVTTSNPDSEDFNPTTENSSVLFDYPTQYSCTSTALLKDLNFKVLDADNFEIRIPQEDLTDFFIALEIAAIESTGTATYAEEAIPTVKLNGNTWEIRQVNQARGLQALLENPENILNAAATIETELVADYVKMSGNAAIASISLGDTGRDTDQVLREVLKQIDPTITDAEISSLSQDLRTKREQAGHAIQKAVSEYLTEARNKYLPDYPIETIAVDSMSTDFMVVFDIDPDNGTVKDLKPVLVDINFYYGTSGLSQADEEFQGNTAEPPRGLYGVVADNHQNLLRLVNSALSAV